MKQHSLKNNSFWDALCGQEKNCLFLLMALSFVTIFFQLGTRSLENQCYIRYAEVAREMLRSGDWIVPHINGELYTHKPALVIWLIALPSALAGKVTPLLARLPSAISALAIIGLTYFLGKRMFRDFRVGAFAGLILLSSKEFFWQAKVARVDMVFTLFLLFSLVCFYEAFLSSGKKRFSLFIFFFVGMALGTLTKGPAIILFYLGPVTVFLFFKKRLRVLTESSFCWGWSVFVLILLSWVLPYISRVPWATFREKFILAEIFSRPEPFYYYVVEFWTRFAPWSLFVPITVLFFFRKNPDQRDERLFLLSWIGVILVPLLLLHNKSYRYLLPIFPAYSIILGAAFKEGLLSWVPNQHDWLTRFWKYPSYFYLYALLIAFLPAPFLTWWFTKELAPVVLSVTVSFLGIFLVVYSIRKGKALVQFVVLGLVTVMCFETYFYFIAREDKMHSPVMELAENIQSRVAPEELCYFDPGGHIKILLNFYLDTVIPNLGSPSEVLAFFNQPGKSRACFMSEKGFSQIFQTASHKGFEVFPIRYDKKETYFLVIAKKE